jgi:protein involved in polysaccharide export with SLBB domain
MKKPSIHEFDPIHLYALDGRFESPEIGTIARMILGFIICLVLVSVCLQGSVHAAPAVVSPGLQFSPALSDSAASQSEPKPAPVAVQVPESGTPQSFDYRANLGSDVFGAQLFSGAFARQGAAHFNPDYVISVGDSLQVRMWGGFELDAQFTVDPKGNIFLPHVGPVKVLGLRNQDLQKTIEEAVRRVYRANVYSYASLGAAQPVRVFVGGFVHRPGLYNGTSTDSLLHYLDQAGGIDPNRGSFLDVQVKRGDKVRAVANLYDFLLDGRMPLIQLGDGDVIFVTPRKNTVKVSGLVENAKRFEFAGPGRHSVADVVKMAKPLAQATHIRVVRNSGTVKNVEYYPMDKASPILLENGDELEFTADKKPGTITVRVEGEHQSPQEYVLPYGAKLGELMKNIQFTANSDAANLQLYRLSVRERQKTMLATALKSLETSVLTARSSTNEESRLRKDEADLMLQWVERARKVEPSGQVIIAKAVQPDDFLLESGDILRIPKQDGLVLVNGEVIFPNAVAFDPGLELKDYIKRAGGYSQSADTSRVIVAHRDGSFEEAGTGNWSLFGNARNRLVIQQGDEILVLPKIQTKSIEVTRGISQIVYQLAIAAKVILDL